jgi:16S rRNA G966 N2-methylase RsmD
MPIVHEWRMPVVSGHFKDAIAKPESFSLLYLNPPYDSEIGSAGNNRMDLVSSRETGVLEVGEMVAAIDYNGPWV